MSEEIRDASDTLTKFIFWGVIVNVILGYIGVLTLCFTITDPSAILDIPIKYPFIQLFYNTVSPICYAGANIMTEVIVVTLLCAVIAEIAAASRQIWSFARDGGLPFSGFLSKVRLYSSHWHCFIGTSNKHRNVSITHTHDAGISKLPHSLLT